MSKHQTARALAQDIIDERIEAFFEELKQRVREGPEDGGIKHMAYYMILTTLSRRAYDRATDHQDRTKIEELKAAARGENATP